MSNEKITTRDPANNFYIHLKSESFLNSANKAKINAYNKEATSKVYMENADYIRRRYMKSRGYLDDLEGNKKYYQEMNAILDLYATSNSPETDATLASYVQAHSNEIVEQIKKATSMSNSVRYLNETNIGKNLSTLKDYVKELNALIKMIKKYDSKAIDLAAEAAGVTRQTIRNRNGLASNPDSAFFMTANKTGQTSLQNLSRKVKEIERVMKEMRASGGNPGSMIKKQVSYIDAGTGKIRVRKFSDLFGGLGTQLTNIQGGIGEMMAFVVAEEGINKGLLDSFKTSKDVEIKMETTGSDVVKNQLLGLNATSVSDTKIVVKFDGDGNASSTMNIGISSKAIFTNNKEKRLNSSSTTFGTTNVAGLLARANLWEHEFQYLFFNLIVPHEGANGGKDDLYKQSEQMRRYVGAKAMLRMLGGLEGDKGDTVYFLKYQDAMYPVEDYFYGLSNLAMMGKAVPIASISSARTNLNNTRQGQQQGETPAQAGYRRSMLVRSKALNLIASVNRSMGTKVL